jgi:NAD(P)-dependent dehydrogenase (short-subunit alcohol dehydrogenase family)
MPDQPLSAAIVLGARNLGAAITLDLIARGVRVATIARTRSDLNLLARDGAITITADAADPGELAAALDHAANQVGRPELIVNAVSPPRPPDDGNGFGGGSIASSSIAGFEAWALPVAQQALVFLGAATRALQTRPGTLVQVTGAPARRTNPERGLISAGMAAVRSLTHAAAQELRESGVHVALLIVDGIIESPKTAAMSKHLPPEALVRHEDVAHAVHFLATQTPRGMTHEVVLTPAAGRWIP